MTRGQAEIRRGEILQDREFGARLLAGDAKARAELREINAALAGVPISTGTGQSIAAMRLNDLMADPDFRARYVNGDTEARREMRELRSALAATDDQ